MIFANWLDHWIDATAWEMTTPKAYGAFHLLFVAIGLALSIWGAYRLRTVSEKGNRRILLTIGLLLLGAEVYKQLFYFFNIESWEYAWWIFPFQLCSVPMYLCLIAPLLKPGRVQQGMYDFMMIYNLLGGGISFAEPSGLLHPYWTLTLHALVWHMMLVFLGLYLGFSGRAGKQMQNYKSATKTFLALCLIAFAINLILRGVSDGSINMFFVGPADSPLAVFETISKRFGWYISTALYIPAVCLGAFLVFLPFHAAQKRARPRSPQPA